MPSESDGGGSNTGTSGATASARGGNDNGGGPGARDPAQQAQAARDAKAESDKARDARDAREAANRAAADNTPAPSFRTIGAAGDQGGGDPVAAKQEAYRGLVQDRNAYAYTAAPREVTNMQALRDTLGPLTTTTQSLGGKNGPRDVSVENAMVSPAQILGRSVTYNEAKALQNFGLGNLAGVNPNNVTGSNLPTNVQGLTTNNIGQTVDSIVASTEAGRFAEKVWTIAKNFIPGVGLIQLAADLASGKTTLGNLMVGIGINKFAPGLKMSPTDVAAIANGQIGDLFTGQLAKYAIGDVAKTYGPNAGLAAVIGLNETGAMSGLSKMMSPANMNFNTTGKVADAFNTGLQNLGITMGTGSGRAPTTPGYVGTSQQDAIDRYIGNGISSGSSSAPAVAPAASGNISSSGSYSGGLPYMANLGSTSGLYRIGDTNYSPYSQDLDQLDLAADEFTKQSDIGNIPVYNTDVAKMASAPFAQASDPYAQYNDPFAQYAAAGGSIHHFAEGGDVAPTAEQLEQRAELQARAQYYKNLDAEKQRADIMSALKNLSGVGAAEAKPQSSPLIRLGQVGNYTPPKVLPQLAALLQSRGMRLAEGGQPEDHKHPNYDGNPVFRTGGLSGLGGKYVEGKGDGTSDDITAMLADGEYVFSADVVSALGNGSNKAGAQVLDKTVEAIRSRARSTAPDKLPPDAKSPLEYMQAVKGKKYG